MDLIVNTCVQAYKTRVAQTTTEHMNKGSCFIYTNEHYQDEIKSNTVNNELGTNMQLIKDVIFSPGSHARPRYHPFAHARSILAASDDESEQPCSKT